jgi:SAM-dependent methyltransferase
VATVIVPVRPALVFILIPDSPDEGPESGLRLTATHEVDRMTFKDHFSGHAADYSSFRPAYPAALFEQIALLASAHDLAWDCATGNGQAALGLAPYFRAVLATDASRQQVGQARIHERVAYVVAPAERSPLANGSVDIVTVAQAVHWFDLERFYAEVRRVSKPGGVLAVWCYHFPAVSPEVDAVLRRLYDVLGHDRPAEWRLIESGYAELPFPFEEISAPRFQIARRWALDHLLDYVRTASACRRYLRETGTDPTNVVRQELEATWGDPVHEREVIWPLILKVGRIG